MKSLSRLTRVAAITVSVGAASFTAQAQEIVGRVVSSTPVVSQVGVPRQVCTAQPVTQSGTSSGGGALLGALIGGVIGNTIGHGGGRAAATGIGMVGGAMIGDQISNTNSGQARSQQSCTTQTFYESRTVAYNVVYEVGGRQYSVQMPHDPGPTIRLQVTPIGAVSSQPLTDASRALYEQPAVAYSQVSPQVQYVQQVQVVPSSVVYPASYGHPIAYPYFAPIALGLSLNSGHRHHNAQPRHYRHPHWHGGR